MAIVDLVKFLKLDNELTDNEFFNEFCKRIGRETIISALYEHFSERPAATDNATRIQTTIMLQRKVKPKQQPLCKCIDELPSEIISNCASFLPYFDYFRFAQCNRTIYFSCYSPSKIHQFDMSKHHEENVNSCAFKNVVKLYIDLKAFNKWSSSKQKMWESDSSLQYLRLYGDYTNRGSEDIDLFLKNIAIKTDNVRKITIDRFHGCASNIFDALIKCGGSNTEKIGIGLWEQFAPDSHISLDPQILRQKLPNVTRLELISNSVDLHTLIIGAYRDQLTKLCVKIRSTFSNLIYEALASTFGQSKLKFVVIRMDSGSEIGLNKLYNALNEQVSIDENQSQCCLYSNFRCKPSIPGSFVNNISCDRERLLGKV